MEKTLEEAERWVEEARWLEDMGRSPSSLPTWQLAQMAEAGPSALGKEPVRRKLCPTMGGKTPRKAVPHGWKSQEDQEVLAWHSCSLGDLTVLKEHRAPYQETPLLMASPWDSPSSGQNWSVLPREHHYMPAGGCRSICGWPHGRCQPLCHTCEMGDNYAQKTFS